MRDTISQFMWGFQPYFRMGLERVTNNVFEQIGFGLGARSYLIGFTDDDAAPFPICFEPETDPLAEVDLTDVERCGREAYANSQWSRFVIGSPRHHARFHADLLNRCRGDAIRDFLESSASGSDRYYFVGLPAMVEGFRVHPVIAVPRRRWDSMPTLRRTEIADDRFEIVPSLQHSVVRELLRQAATDLSGQEAPEDYSLHWADRSDLVRRGAQAFVTSVCRLAGDDFSYEIGSALNEVAAQPYEGRSGAGGVLLADPTRSDVSMSLKFVKPIPIPDTRSIRKSLEMSGAGQYLLCRDARILGLAKLRDTYDNADEAAFSFEIVGRGSWELLHGGVSYLRMTDTRPSLPRPRLDESRFRDIAQRVFPSADPAAIDRLWQLTTRATAAAHGTMLVVHPDAAAEAERLYPQAQLVEAVHLDDSTLGASTNIDGAVLLDPDGLCHAVGVILDGEATGSGLASRGARFNSAIRYHQARGARAMIIIVSEDGMIDLLPDLYRRVSRAEVEKSVSLLEASVTDDTDFEVFFRHHDHIESLAFYLSADQCDRVNAARSSIEAQRGHHGNITGVSWQLISPQNLMDDSYFLD